MSRTSLSGMCASYGLDPRLSDPDGLFAGDAELLGMLREWAAANAGETLLPTGKNLRNLNPVLRRDDEGRRLDLGWWGYLVDGAPAKFASINTRAERLASGRGPLPARAIVPATSWREMAKPSRVWQRFASGDNALVGMAAVTRPGRTSDGEEYTCFSIVMQPAAPHLEQFHDRMPLLIAPDFADEWLGSSNAQGSLIGAAMDAAVPVAEAIRVTAEVRPAVARPPAAKPAAATGGDEARLF